MTPDPDGERHNDQNITLVRVCILNLSVSSFLRMPNSKLKLLQALKASVTRTVESELKLKPSVYNWASRRLIPYAGRLKPVSSATEIR